MTIKAKVKNCITIINVYAPTTERDKDDPTNLSQLCVDISNVKNDSASKTSLFLMAGDFHAKSGKRMANHVQDNIREVSEIQAGRC